MNNSQSNITTTWVTDNNVHRAIKRYSILIETTFSNNYALWKKLRVENSRCADSDNPIVRGWWKRVPVFASRKNVASTGTKHVLDCRYKPSTRSSRVIPISRFLIFFPDIIPSYIRTYTPLIYYIIDDINNVSEPKYYRALHDQRDIQERGKRIILRSLNSVFQWNIFNVTVHWFVWIYFAECIDAKSTGSLRLNTCQVLHICSLKSRSICFNRHDTISVSNPMNVKRETPTDSLPIGHWFQG